MKVTRAVQKSLYIVFKKFLKPNFHRTIGKFVKDYTELIFKGKEDGIYCSLSKTKGYKFAITYGVGFIYRVFKLENRNVSKKEFLDLIPKLKIVLLGTYFHEVAHLIFTAMENEKISSLPILERDGKKIPQAQLLHQLFNAWEDIVIESAMAYRYRSSLERRGGFDPNSVGSYLRENRDFVMQDMMTNYVDNVNTYQSLVAYTLLKMSYGKKFVGTNKFFDAHPENKDYMLKFLAERNADKRIDVIIEYWNWLLTTEIILPEISEDENPIPGSMGGKSTSVGKSKALPKGSMVPDPTEESGGTPSPSGEVEKGEEDEEENGDGEIDSGTESGDEDDGGGEVIDNNYEPDDDLFDELNDNDFDWSIHEEYDLNSANLEVDVSDLHKIRDKMSRISEELASYFILLKERNKPDYFGNLQSGSSLDMSAVRKGERLNVFKEMIDRSNDKVSGIVLLCDNSGSMAGDKADLLQLGVIAMSEMMNKLNIKFSVYAFSDMETSKNVTFKLKSFTDNYDDPNILNNFNVIGYKTYRKVVDDVPHPLFHGNEDGYHIEYLSRMLEKEQLDNRIMIVFSDGYPYKKDLIHKAIARHKNIHYIGIGLCHAAVSKYYKEHKVFKNEKSLELLPSYLGELLLRLIQN